jgi:EpsI family protein
MNKKYLIVVLLTLLASIAVFKVHNAERLKNEKIFSFPLKIGEWSGKDIPMEEWVFESLATPYAILRNYRSLDGEIVNLAITWYDDKEVAFHAPEDCLGGVGNKVKEKSVYHVKVNGYQDYTIGKLLVEKSNVRSLVLYYFINDSYITPSQTKLRARILLKRLQFKRTSAAFVRLMMPIIKNQEYTREVLEKYLRAIFSFVIEYTDTTKIKLQLSIALGP